MDYYIGWDVGAWKCKRTGGSCDALFVMDKNGSLGCHRDNMSVSIQKVCDSSVEEKQATLIDGWFSLAKVEGHAYSAEHKYFVAIDTPLGWPKTFTQLMSGNLSKNWKFNSKDRNIENTMLFRRTERELGSSLSAIVDSIGSQSTKGMALLCSLGATLESWGVWKAGNITLFETYPTACLRSEAFVDWMCGLKLKQDIRCSKKQRTKKKASKKRLFIDQDDIFDAGVCACLAKAFTAGNPKLKQPPEDTDDEESEGWIFYPDDKPIEKSLISKYKSVVNTPTTKSFAMAVKQFRELVAKRKTKSARKKK
ncbi:DUF429 domain-containing protein [bacterium]|nr:DUF429 domain-containing protein [bacterium]